MPMVIQTFRVVWRALLALALLLGLALPSFADEFTGSPALDALFAQLRTAEDATAANEIDQRIWLAWVTPPDTELATRMRAVLDARSGGDTLGTILLLNQLVVDYPGYAEAWNQRATMHYMMGDFEASIADCAKVLELEPRHFGALSGRALMYLQLGERALALKDMAAALAIHPFLRERDLFPELQQEITRT